MQEKKPDLHVVGRRKRRSMATGARDSGKQLSTTGEATPLLSASNLAHAEATPDDWVHPERHANILSKITFRYVKKTRVEM